MTTRDTNDQRRPKRPKDLKAKGQARSKSAKNSASQPSASPDRRGQKKAKSRAGARRRDRAPEATATPAQLPHTLPLEVIKTTTTRLACGEAIDQADNPNSVNETKNDGLQPSDKPSKRISKLDALIARKGERTDPEVAPVTLPRGLDWRKLPYHPAANIFPMTKGKERQRFNVSVGKRLRHPIVLHEWQVLDGRHRHLACVALGIEPRFVEWVGEGSPVDYVFAVNRDRRHLSTSQLAMIAARTMVELSKEARKRQATSTGGASPQLRTDLARPDECGRARNKAADLAGASAHLTQDAFAVLTREVKELVQQVDNGDVKVSAAVEVAKLPDDELGELIKKGPAAVREKAAELRKARTQAKAKTATGDSIDPVDAAGANAESQVARDGAAVPEHGEAEEDFLRGLPIRRELADPTWFDQDALLWLRDRPIVEQLRKQRPPSASEVRMGIQYWNVTAQYGAQRAKLILVEHPDRWPLCPRCKGSQVDCSSTGPCVACNGAGFMILLEGQIVPDDLRADSPES